MKRSLIIVGLSCAAAGGAHLLWHVLGSAAEARVPPAADATLAAPPPRRSPLRAVAPAARELCASAREVALHPDVDPLGIARTAADELLSGTTAPLWARGSVELHAGMRSAERLADFSARSRDELGVLEAPQTECVVKADGGWIYQRVDRYSGTRNPVVIEIGVDRAGAVTSLGVRPARARHATAFEAYRTRAPLRLPFDGEWTVGWGGRDLLENRHVVKRDERFAYDFVPPQRGDAPIVAPADGVVLETESRIVDSPIGVDDVAASFGNHVVLDLGDGEFAILAHMKRGSVRVHAGDRVRRGDTIGECGNSGHSTAPHLHFQLQNAPRSEDAEGLPAQFVDFAADGVPVPRGEPLRGQKIEQRATAHATPADGTASPERTHS